MEMITYLSNLIIPFLLFYVIGYGLLAKRDIYSDFLDGAKDGLKTVAGICPTLVGLMTAVGILRASGFLEFLGGILGKVTGYIGLPPDLVPLTLVRMFSSSAATGLLLDIFKEFGTDSPTGLMAGIVMSATESVFYCMSVYYGSVKIRKTRYTLPGAIISTAAGVAAAVWIVNCLM
ncbi:MAG: spore maturation protein [Eubacteriales bacterium]|nr:spore maturation protein [Eubacteriales bacterium]